jgi:flagellin FlaB
MPHPEFKQNYLCYKNPSYVREAGIDQRLLIHEGEVMSSYKHKDEGFTGLEAAIVLIAFVVVAAVFSYVVLGAGFFTTQKAQQTVYSAVGQASSTLEVMGNVYGTGSGSGSATDTVQFINFSVGLAPGGTPVDFSKVVIVFSNSTVSETLINGTSTTVPFEPVSNGWGIPNYHNSPAGSNSLLLQPNEQFDISCDVGGIPANSQFTIEVRPAVGAAFSIVKTIPAGVYAVNNLN